MTDTAPPSDAVLQPFNPRRFRLALWLDKAILLSMGVVIVAAMISLALQGQGSSSAAMLAVVLVFAGWIAVGGINARVGRALPQLTTALEHQPAVGEAALASLMRKRPLSRGVRLMLYHRLALLRHRQERFAESAAICQCILTTPDPGTARQHRAHLLLILVEARLELHDLPGAFLGLCELSQTRVSLAEALQRLALRTRYELLIGRADAVLYRMREKAALSELMPAPQCGAFHALLAHAADRRGQQQTSDWLWARVELLCDAAQVQRLRESKAG